MFTGKETIAEIIKILPEAPDVLIAHGLHCVGCSVGAYESLMDGCYGHGFSKEEIQGLIEDLNLCLKESKQQEIKPVFLTKKAINKISEFQQKQNKEGWGIFVKASKKQGQWKYSLDFKKEKEVMWKEVFCSRVYLFLLEDTYTHLLGYKIDYIKVGDEEGFKFEKTTPITQ